MKNLAHIKNNLTVLIFFSNLSLFAESLRDNIFPPVSKLENIYTTEDGKSNTLIFEFTGGKFKYE